MKSLMSLVTGWKKILLEVLIIALLYWGIRYYQQQDIVKGQAPVLQGVMLNQKAIDWSDYQGKPLLVHFWATWCRVCQFEQDSIEAIAKDYQVITIASWSDDTREYMQKHGLSYPVLDDPQGHWAKRYGISVVPVSFMLDADGKIAFIESGYSSEIGLRLRLGWLEL